MTMLTSKQVQILSDLVANNGAITAPTDVVHSDLIVLLNERFAKSEVIDVGKVVLSITDAGRAALAAWQPENDP